VCDIGYAYAMPMRATTVRFSEDLWQLLDDESTMQGISAAQFVRDATIVRLAFLAGRRGDSEAQLSMEAIAERAARRQRGEREPSAVHAPARLRELRDTRLLDSPAAESFDRLTRLTATVLNVPVALVSLVDDDRQFFKSCLGLSQPWAQQRQTPLSHSFCRHVVESGQPLVISDAREHPVLRDNPAIYDIGIIAYMGVPLITPTGNVLGTLCAVDHQPRHWTTEQVEILSNLAGSVLSEIQLHAAQYGHG
jgi:GAF domain-containing protein